jgi:hypothetical protein
MRRYFLFAAVVHCIVIAGPVYAASDDCDLSGFNKTKPDPLLNPDPNRASFDWGSDVDQLELGQGLQFWNYVRNRDEKEAGSLWVSWDAAKLYTSSSNPVEPGKTICTQYRVFFLPGHETSDDLPGYVIDNNAKILYGGQSKAQSAPAYISSPVGVLSKLLQSWLSVVNFSYVGAKNESLRGTASVRTARDGNQYTFELHVVPETFDAVIGDLPDFVSEEQLSSITRQFASEGARARVAVLPTEELTQYLRAPDTITRGSSLIVHNPSKAYAKIQAGPQEIPSVHNVIFAIIDQNGLPVVGTETGLILPTKPSQQ